MYFYTDLIIGAIAGLSKTKKDIKNWEEILDRLRGLLGVNLVNYAVHCLEKSFLLPGSVLLSIYKTM